MASANRGACYAVLFISPMSYAALWGGTALHFKVNTLVFCLGSSCACLKVLVATLCNPGDPVTMHPSLFKGPANCWYWSDYAYLLCAVSLCRKAVLYMVL